MIRIIDNHSTREIIEYLHIQPSSRVRDGLKGSIYIKIPDKVRKDMGITNTNQSQFRIIIVKKDAI